MSKQPATDRSVKSDTSRQEQAQGGNGQQGGGAPEGDLLGALRKLGEEILDEPVPQHLIDLVRRKNRS